ncbi:unnamed protein product [Coregonus sp. 'balchen']|nr:unnamed protein product [Coregonus sp. 'balchen']
MSGNTSVSAGSAQTDGSLLGERCYFYTQDTQDRQDCISSRYHCLSVGGNLVMVKSEEEQPEKGDTRELCAWLSPGDSHRAGWYATMCKNSLKTICVRTQGTLQ